jgi:hypothetical protein
VGGAERAGHPLGMAGFIVTGPAERRRERVGRPRPRGKRGDERGVDAAGQEHPDRHVGDGADRDGVGEDLEQVVGVEGLIAHIGGRPSRRVRAAAIPPPLPRFELGDPAVDRQGSWHVPELEVRRQRVGVDLRPEALHPPHSAELAREHDPVWRVPDVQRLLADGVAGEPQLLPPHVPQGDGVHAVHLVEGLPDAPAGDGLEEHLGIAGADEGGTQDLEPAAELAMSVDLPVERDHPPAVL